MTTPTLVLMPSQPGTRRTARPCGVAGFRASAGTSLSVLGVGNASYRSVMWSVSPRTCSAPCNPCPYGRVHCPPAPLRCLRCPSCSAVAAADASSIPPAGGTPCLPSFHPPNSPFHCHQRTFSRRQATPATHRRRCGAFQRLSGASEEGDVKAPLGRGRAPSPMTSSNARRRRRQSEGRRGRRGTKRAKRTLTRRHRAQARERGRQRRGERHQLPELLK